jgi:integrase
MRQRVADTRPRLIAAVAPALPSNVVRRLPVSHSGLGSLARPTALRANRARQLDEEHSAAGAWQKHGLVFTTEIGTPLEPRNVLRRFEVLAERAGLRGVTLHTLRHSAASFVLAAGTHTKVVQEHLGHSSYAITADIYSHVGPAQQREAADRLDEALRCCTSAALLYPLL